MAGVVLCGVFCIVLYCNYIIVMSMVQEAGRNTHTHTYVCLYTQSFSPFLTLLATSHLLSSSPPSSTRCCAAFWPCGAQTEALWCTDSARGGWGSGRGTVTSKVLEAVTRSKHVHAQMYAYMNTLNVAHTPPCSTPAPPTAMYLSHDLKKRDSFLWVRPLQCLPKAAHLHNTGNND